MAEEKPRGRILALDVGSRRIGLAVTDPLGITAQGLETLARTNKRADFKQLSDLIRELGIAEIVVGNPLRMSGESGTQAEKIAAFAEELSRRFKLPVHLWDERITSAESHRLLNESGMDRMERKGVVDRMAAVLILQSYMSSRPAQPAEHHLD
jgi:putative Holliday junction resolvase